MSPITSNSSATRAHSAVTGERPPSHADYAKVGVGLTLFAGWVTFVVQRTWVVAPQPGELLGPMLAMVLLVALVWGVGLIFRNYAVLSGLISGNYFRRFDVDPPPDWVERPARTFNNLMQVPPLFHLVCVLMMQTGRVDRAQLILAWTFVAARSAHALIYMVWNHLPSRFGTFVLSFVTLLVMYVRFALQASDLW